MIDPTPLVLMKMALALLDEGGEHASLTACHLQAAVDAASAAHPMQGGEMLPDERLFPLKRPSVRA
ncbi:hypothetical protein [Sphingomonas sp. CARO-RG-8B-R24-01]|uniref:hypothetical protein n=1 Tax=Sphingomonas sp. CARO-RG-8B-R24-01 TaxID=2914831 RepID=UPI001F5A14E1|nr:hypothetical protein [Sphingomonas sp. CARO-RG-8B-R24-01]